MIALQLEDYCQEGCRMFKPDTVISGVISYADSRPFSKCTTDVIITCEWASQCRYLKNYLKRTGKTDEDETDKETEGTDN